MGTFTNSNSRIIQRPAQRVLINGTTRHDIECVGVSLSLGLSPAQATMRIPRAMFGDDLDALRDASVVVYAHDALLPSDRAPIFRGFLDVKTSHEDARTNTVSILALSPAAYLDRVYCGQGAGEGVVYWYKRHKLTGALTGWTFLNVIQDLFAGLPSAWMTVIGLGNITGLSEFAAANAKLDDVVLTTATYQAALAQLLERTPGVGVRERFTDTLTLYDFFPLGSSGLGNRVITLPSSGNGPEQGAYATAAVERSDVEDVYSRVIAFGRPAETMVTTSTTHSTAPLTPAWANTFVYPTSYPAYVPGPPAPSLSAAETAVIADPDAATPGSPTFQEEYSHVFRVFKLPACLRLRRILQDNVATVDDGTGDGERRVELQVFRATAVWPDDVPAVGDTPTESTVYELIQGARVTEDGFVILPKPALDYFGVSIDAGTQLMVQTYRPVHVGVTLTVQEIINHGRQYDTGVVGDVRLPGIATEGAVLSWTNNACQFQQIATGNSAGQGLTDATGEHYFNAFWYDRDTDSWQLTSAGSQSVTRDDGEFLQQDAEQALAERNQRRTQVSVMLPAVCTSLHPGDMVRVLGRDLDGKLLQIHGVTFDFAAVNTTFTASDQVPWSTEVTTRLPDWRARDMGPGTSAADSYYNPGGNSPALGTADIIKSMRGTA